MMHFSSLALLAVFLLLEYVFRKKFPELHRKINRKIELPAAILLSILVTAYCGFLVYAIYDTLTSSMSNGDKAFLTIFIAIVISIYVVLVVFSWKQYIRHKNEARAAPDSPPSEDTSAPETE